MLASLLAAAAILGVSQDVQAPPPTAAEIEEARQNERVCRREHVVGSNRPQRICMTRRQWARLQDESRETRDRMGREQPNALPGSPG